MNTVKFGELDSYADFDLILTSKTIGAPAIKTETVDVPGADGTLDLTEFFGEVFYENRELKFDFACKTEPYLQVYSNFKNSVHGKRMNVSLSDDPGFYYLGRVSINEWETDEELGVVSVDVDAEPYKYKNAVTTSSFSVTDSATKVFSNLRKSVVPTFTLGAAMQIKFGEKTYQASAGTYTNPEILFKEGNNTVIFTGTGSVTVKYQERGL